MSSYDVIVLGTGGVGSAAAYHLARRGARVLGLDRFPGGHSHGSSHGQTRIIRKAYFEHSDYVPLLHRAYELWHELEGGTGHQLYNEVGLIQTGPPDGVVVAGVMEAARQHQLAVETISREDFAERFRGFVLADGDAVVFEQNAGFLLVEQCVLAHLAEAAKCGAELKTDQEVVGWESDEHGVTVRTDLESYSAKSLVITAGAWATDLLAELGVTFKIRRKHLHWYACADTRYRADHGCPGFFCETSAGYVYGIPQIDDQGVKVADHTAGTEIDNPLTDDKSIEPKDERRVESFLRNFLPGVSRTRTRHEVCYYTMSPDEHFIVDVHPKHSNVAFAAGLSGHGFKFTSVLGEVLADLVTGGKTTMPIDFLAQDRFRM
jgi:monomeric sarcosine oxidase